MTLYEAIKNMPLLRHFTEDEKIAFSKMNHCLVKYEKGRPIMREGDANASLYLLVKGTVVVAKAGLKRPVAKLIPGSIFGEMSFLTRKPRRTSVIADQEVILLEMTPEFFRDLDHGIRDNIKNYLIELLANRLEAMNEALTKLSRLVRGNILF